MSLTSFSASGYTVHSMIDRYANGGITMAYSQPIADVLREFFVLSNIDAGFEEQAGCGVFTFRTKLHCRMQTAQMTVLVREDNFSTRTAGSRRDAARRHAPVFDAGSFRRRSARSALRVQIAEGSVRVRPADKISLTQQRAMRSALNGERTALVFLARPYALPPARSALAACLRRLFSLHACMTSASAITP